MATHPCPGGISPLYSFRPTQTSRKHRILHVCLGVALFSALFLTFRGKNSARLATTAPHLTRPRGVAPSRFKGLRGGDVHKFPKVSVSSVSPRRRNQYMARSAADEAVQTVNTGAPDKLEELKQCITREYNSFFDPLEP
eukprot:1359377-Amorphochlora_amoeboformis.AAC.2